MMDETSRSRNIQFGLYALALVLALTVRLVRLDAWPLTDEEARWAMQAFELVKGLRPEIGPQPGYVLLTALAFFVMQAGELAARLVPALFGAALVLAPYFFRDRLGEKAALVLAFLLAFEPGLLAMSRLAGSPIIAVTAFVLAWGAWRTGKIRAAGVLAGIALLGGPQLWPGLIGLTIAYGLTRGLAPTLEPARFERGNLLRALAYAVGTFFILGSFFLLAPGALGAGLQSLTSYFGGLLGLSDVPAPRLLFALLIYQFPALILGSVALVRGILRRDDLTISLGLWLLVALVLALANPARQVYDLAWALLPLWVLTALEVARHLVPVEEETWETLGMMAFTIVLLAFSAQNFSSIALVQMEPSQLQLRWILLGASLLLLALSIFMVAYGWSTAVAKQGSVWGALLLLAIFSISTAMAAGGLRAYQTVEMWPPGLPARYADSLTSQLDEIAEWRKTPALPLDVTVAEIDSPALRWTLREWDANFVNATTLTESPSILIVPGDIQSPELQAGYRGQDFIWRTQVFWDTFTPPDWLRWSFQHKAAEGQETLILWIRSDLFIDSQNEIP